MDILKSLVIKFLAAGFLFLLVLPALCHAEEASAVQVDRIVAAILDVYGGKDAVAKVKSVVARGSIADFMKDRQGAYARYFTRPQNLRIEIMPDQGGEVRILSGNRGWQGSAEALKEARAVTIQSMIYQYTYLDLPMGLADNSYRVSYAGSQELKGRSAEVLEIEVKGAPRLRIFVDRESHLILRVASAFDMGMGASELSTEYEDFRPVGKVLFPFRLVNYAGGIKLSTISLSDIQTTITIPPELFTPGKPGSPK
jgi:outer membrane lipoprotein-sorting protein